MRQLNMHQGLLLSPLLWTMALCGYVAPCQGQKIDRRMPGVYLTFKEFVNPNQVIREDSVRLVLHNNTRWPIFYTKHYNPDFPDGDSIAYEIELENGCIDERKYVDVVTTGKLLPGKVTSLMVPREDFQRKSRIYVSFSYSWEVGQYGTLRGEPVHRVYFRANELP
jgi:hypothetical protein